MRPGHAMKTQTLSVRLCALRRCAGSGVGALGRRSRRHALLRQLAQITPGNVGKLVRAWEFRTGDLDEARAQADGAHQVSGDAPVRREQPDLLHALQRGDRARSRHGRAEMALRPEDRPGTSGPETASTAGASPIGRTSRRPQGAACRSRIFMGTNDVRVIALDAKTGVPCADFGGNGEVKLDIGMKLEWPGEFQITSAPVVVRGVVIVGSAISDNRRVDAPRGTVRGLRCADRAPALDLGPARCHAHRGRPRQCLGADVGRRGAGHGLPADLLAQPRFLGRQAARQQRARQLRWWRCRPRPARSSGRFRACITTSGTTICRRSRRSRASTPATAGATW